MDIPYQDEEKLMRPQQNRRMRGRGNNNNNSNNNNNNNNNRKGPNPLTRSYESNGPDVKIRGTAQQIAEKYTTLARDAQSSGDRVMAENYLQHAEHYNRIIATALAQQAATQQQQRDMRDDEDEDGDDNDAGFDGNSNNNQGQRGDQNQQPRGDRQNRDNRDRDNRGNRENREEPAAASDGSGPQPVIEGVPAEVALNQDDAQGESRRQRAPRRERAPRPEQAAGEVVVPVAASSPAELAASVQSAEAADDTGERKPRRTRRPRLKADEGEGTAEKSDDVGEAAA
jgi:hypothetical protein